MVKIPHSGREEFFVFGGVRTIARLVQSYAMSGANL
jgi:hypothetical protein